MAITSDSQPVKDKSLPDNRNVFGLVPGVGQCIMLIANKLDFVARLTSDGFTELDYGTNIAIVNEPPRAVDTCSVVRAAQDNVIESGTISPNLNARWAIGCIFADKIIELQQCVIKSDGIHNNG